MSRTTEDAERWPGGVDRHGRPKLNDANTAAVEQRRQARLHPERPTNDLRREKIRSILAPFTVQWDVGASGYNSVGRGIAELEKEDAINRVVARIEAMIEEAEGAAHA